MNGRAGRRARVAAFLRDEGLGAALFEDAEGRRDQSLRYLSGHPGDALLVISATGASVLVAWDLNLARLLAAEGGGPDLILAYAEFERQPHKALAGALSRLGVPPGSRVELPSTLPHPRFLELERRLEGYELACRLRGVDAFVGGLRSVKDESEIEVYRRAAAITNGIVARLEEGVRSGAIASEIDAALLIERSSREALCEGPGFETLAAGPGRSWGIHAFPAYGAGPFAGPGMSILDFGVKLEGYVTDVTMSFLRGGLGPRRERMLALVEEARAEAVAMLRPGEACRGIARRVDEVFADAGFAMPHALGHGIGLDPHEAPFLRSRDDCEDLLAAGQVIAVEPGLYDPELGGIRYEDDYLITEGGAERLTSSRIVKL